jgi:3-mercaptopyruvate sulfurtransferase SseA
VRVVLLGKLLLTWEAVQINFLSSYKIRLGSPTITYCYKSLQSLQTFLQVSVMTVPLVLYGGSLSSMTVIADNRKGDLFHGLVF